MPTSISTPSNSDRSLLKYIILQIAVKKLPMQNYFLYCLLYSLFRDKEENLLWNVQAKTSIKGVAGIKYLLSTPFVLILLLNNNNNNNILSII